MRVAAQRRIKQTPGANAAPVARLKTFQAPVRGWIRNESLAGGKDGGAYQLDNIFPMATGARVRKGTSKYATVGSGARIGALIPYVLGATKKLFAANTTAIYDISAADTNDQYTKILLHFDGADASTTITDSNAGGSAHTWSVGGNAQLDTGVLKFGSATLLLDGTGDYVTTPNHSDFALGSGDFTIELWFNCTAPAGVVRRICGQCDSSVTVSTASFRIRRQTTGEIVCGVSQSSVETSVGGTTQYTDALNTGWHHLAFVRTGNTLKLFLDGVQEGGDVAFTGSVNESANAVSIGRLGEAAGNEWLGSLDEFRYSVGVARWTSNFTPPTTAYEYAAAVGSLTSADWQFVQFTTSGGTYLRLVNGADTPLVYDGATWGTAPLITGVTDENLDHVWAFKNRLFFVEKNTLNAWYLATDAIGGAATKFPLGGIFRLGGSLMFGASWSVDTGSGYGEKCVFVSTEGEVAVYEGTDPASAASWALEGVYRIGRPLGKRAVFSAGGDLAIATDIGIVPLSQAMTTDAGALGGKAITHQIEDEWTIEVPQRVGVYPWHMQMWPTKQMLVVAMPSYSSLALRCFVANIRTGAWCRFTGWDTHCLGLYQDRLFFGTSTGTVIEAESGGYDQGATYTGIYVGIFSDLGAPDETKQVNLIRPTTLSTQTITDKASVCVDYVVSLPTAPSASPVVGGSNSWGTGLWGTAVWGGGTQYTKADSWRAAIGIGQAIAPAWQVTIGQSSAPDMILVKTAIEYEMGQTPG